MSATDELRALLDERGVEWSAPTSFDGTARYDTTTSDYWFHEFNGKMTIHGLTPAQAIAATLGDTDATCERHGDADERDQLKAENAKLWELITDVHESLKADKAGMFHNLTLSAMEDDMRELGVEVEG